MVTTWLKFYGTNIECVRFAILLKGWVQDNMQSDFLSDVLSCSKIAEFLHTGSRHKKISWGNVFPYRFSLSSAYFCSE